MEANQSEKAYAGFGVPVIRSQFEKEFAGWKKSAAGPGRGGV